jgi:protein CpxP
MKKYTLLNIRTVSIVSAFCTLLSFPFLSNAYAFHEGGNSVTTEQGRHHGGKGRMKMMSIVLDLTDVQQEKIKAIKRQAKEQHKANQATMKQFKTQAKALIQAEIFDEQAFSALQSRYQANFEQAGLQRAKTRNAIFNVLNTEQQKKWQKVIQGRKAKFSKSRDF